MQQTQMGPTGCPETSVRNYHCSLRNSPEERREIPISAWDRPAGPTSVYNTWDKFFGAGGVAQTEVDLEVSETDVNQILPP